VFANVKKWWAKKCYRWAHNHLYAHSTEYKDLYDWLVVNNSLSEAITGVFKGRRLSFQWIDAPERGRYKFAANLYNRDNPLLQQRHEEFVGSVITEPLDYRERK